MKNKYFNSIDTECSMDGNFEEKGEKRNGKRRKCGNLSKLYKTAHELGIGMNLFTLNDS